MALQTCSDINDAVALESSLGLYLKPISKIKINVQLPKLKIPGQSISSWNVMEKLKAAVKPDQFINLKSLKISANVIKLEGELENKATCERALARLRTTGCLKLSGFSEKLQLRAAHAPCSGPTRHEWEAFYRDAKGVNEMKPGERPDTLHLQDMPVRWFASSNKSLKPSEKILRKAFGGFGRIRRLEIPMNDNESNELTFARKSSLHSELLFEVYVQYEEYVEFSIAMDSLRGKKLVYKDSEGKVFSADIKVDFDRTNYLSERCIKQRAAIAKPNTDTSADSAKHKCDTPTLISIPSTSDSLTAEIKIEKSSSPKFKENEAKCLLKELLLRAEKSEKFEEKKLPLTSSALPSQESTKRKRKNFQNEDKHRKEKDIYSKKKSLTEVSDHKKKKKENFHHDKHEKEKDLQMRKTMKKSLIEESDREKKKKENFHHNDKHEKEKDSHVQKKTKHSLTEDLNFETKKKEIFHNEDKHAKEKDLQIKKKLKKSLTEDSDLEKKKKDFLLEQERLLKQKLLRNLRLRELQKITESREKLRKELAGQNTLKSVLSVKKS